MYNKIHAFLWDQKYYYKKSISWDFEMRRGEVLLRDVLSRLHNRLKERKKQSLQKQHAKGKINHISPEMLQYTWTDALRDLLGLIPILEAHPDICQNRVTQSLSDEEKKQQHALIPKHIRCVIWTKRLLETILSAKHEIFPMWNTDSNVDIQGSRNIEKQDEAKVIQLNFMDTLFPQDNLNIKTTPTEEPIQMVPNTTATGMSQEEKDEMNRRLYEEEDDSDYEYPWQKYNNR